MQVIPEQPQHTGSLGAHWSRTGFQWMRCHELQNSRSFISNLKIWKSERQSLQGSFVWSWRETFRVYRISAVHVKCQERAALPFKTAHQRRIKAADTTESTPPGAAFSRPGSHQPGSPPTGPWLCCVSDTSLTACLFALAAAGWLAGWHARHMPTWPK